MNMSKNEKITTPKWFKKAILAPYETKSILVNECKINFLVWKNLSDNNCRKKVLFVHGGGAHAQWWRFIAPLLTEYEVAALDLSGMGDSGRRTKYSAKERVLEILYVLEACDFLKNSYVVGHSFGGYMAICFAAKYGSQVDGVVIVDSPIFPPGTASDAKPRRALRIQKFYPSFKIAMERFKLLPPQDCKNTFILEFIAKNSIKSTERGWTWKFDVSAMGGNRWQEPFEEHIRNTQTKLGLIYGSRSALLSEDTAQYMTKILPHNAPITKIHDAAHHVMLDQPQLFVTTLKETLLKLERLPLVK